MAAIADHCPHFKTERVGDTIWRVTKNDLSANIEHRVRTVLLHILDRYSIWFRPCKVNSKGSNFRIELRVISQLETSAGTRSL